MSPSRCRHICPSAAFSRILHPSRPLSPQSTHNIKATAASTAPHRQPKANSFIAPESSASSPASAFSPVRRSSTPSSKALRPPQETQDQSKPSPQVVEFTKSSKVAPWFSTHPVKTPFTLWQVTSPFTSTSPGGGVTTCGSLKQGAGGGGAAVAVTGPEHPSSHEIGRAHV